MRLPAFVLFLVGGLIAVWGLRVLYTAAFQNPPGEIPHWVLWPAALILLALAALLLALARSVHRRTAYARQGR